MQIPVSTLATTYTKKSSLLCSFLFTSLQSREAVVRKLKYNYAMLKKLVTMFSTRNETCKIGGLPIFRSSASPALKLSPLLQNYLKENPDRFSTYLSYGLASSRTALGAIAYVLPKVPSAPWVGRSEASRQSVQLFARTLGARDLALGLGHLYSLASGKDTRKWLAAGAIADLGDTVATALDFKKLPKPHAYGVILLTVSAFAVGLYLALVTKDVD